MSMCQFFQNVTCKCMFGPLVWNSPVHMGRGETTVAEERSLLQNFQPCYDGAAVRLFQESAWWEDTCMFFFWGGLVLFFSIWGCSNIVVLWGVYGEDQDWCLWGRSHCQGTGCVANDVIMLHGALFQYDQLTQRVHPSALICKLLLGGGATVGGNAKSWPVAGSRPYRPGPDQYQLEDTSST